ncbi:MAG: CoA transferase, partial [Anaerolineae bacterium]|nr:CoA transferase [Anaerolineae bacterium]
MPGPLAGIRVIDLSQNAPGPFCTMMLGDLGAEVIHIVNPARGGDFGYIPDDDPFIATRYQPHDALMRNKRSLALNLKDPRGRDLIHRLVDGADIFVEEMRP